MVGTTSLYALARDMCLQVHTGTGRDWVQEHGDWRANPGRGLLLDVRKQPEGMGVRKSTTRNASGGNLTGRRSKASLLIDMQATLLTSLPSTNPALSPGTTKDHY